MSSSPGQGTETDFKSDAIHVKVIVYQSDSAEALRNVAKIQTWKKVYSIN